MAQFDVYSFNGQVNWILIAFSIFFLITQYYYASENSSVIKLRENLYLRYLSLNEFLSRIYDQYCVFNKLI